ncbi:hypothetical protein CAEBREN_18599 [Caenorhabditis brenneri]|uniref:Uncharacterized protein n=1 Tax=Caenorhabditis brenneri TaxID=135651 RepID=G0P0Z5_CAEBE|nr:hypothetical protein CAEBREN_18599 [Caenorhabditis brenneri]
MSYCRLENAGVYRATLEAMLFGTVTQEAEDQRFNDSVLEKKAKTVNDLVKRFEKNLKLEDSAVAEEVQAQPMVQPKEIAAAPKPRSRIPCMEEFIDGILRASSPIPQAQVEEEAPVQLQETPILPYLPVRRELDFGILNTIMSYRPTPGCAKVAEAKGSTTPRTKVTILKESPDSAYHSIGSSTPTAFATPVGSSISQAKEEELDIYLKLGRAQLHEQIKKYSNWDAQHLRSIATKVSSMRLSALKKAAPTCPTTQLMTQIYEKCAIGPVNKELDTIVVSIFHLLDEQVHVERISVLEEYIVLKYCKKMMQ